MNLYFISQGDNNGYDTYDSAVVASESEEEASKIHPYYSGYEWNEVKRRWVSPTGWDNYGDWANSPNSVDVEFIGTAKEGTEPGVICASFNAG